MTEAATYESLLSQLEAVRAGLTDTDPAFAGPVGEAMEAITALQGRVTELEGELAAVEDRKRWRKERQHEGIVAAQEKGVTFGRPRMPLPDNFEEVRDLWYHRKLSSRKGAEMLGVSQDTFLRWCRTR
ncbi:MAG: hypothetical protein LUE21_02610 [Oscillospiraceae bacterium]|nr:hypothetical protein [Oscillospiraceae bacterium]